MSNYFKKIEHLSNNLASSHIKLLLTKRIKEDLNKIRFILLVDGPDIKDYKSDEYLSGRAGKTARKLFENYGLSENYNSEVLILAKTPIVSQTPNDLVLIRKKTPEFFVKSQLLMLELLFDIYEKHEIDQIWLLESPGIEGKSIFREFYIALKERVNEDKKFNEKLSSYTHFANNNFELEYLRYYYQNHTSNRKKEEFLQELGAGNIQKIFDSI